MPAGTAVHAAAPGEVALVSEALGGLGTIVLVRHRDDLITTYSTLSNVKVKEGDRVTAGQVIGTVAARDKPELQFDVFRGTTSVDPTPISAAADRGRASGAIATLLISAAPDHPRRGRRRPLRPRRRLTPSVNVRS